MDQAPIKNLFFFSILLFIVLSSGSLQCAQNCCDTATAFTSSNTALVNGCHPLPIKNLETGQTSSLCHRDHSSRQASNDPILLSPGGGLTLALSNIRCDSPRYRSSAPLSLPFFVDNAEQHPTFDGLPLTQNLKQLRSTILLI